MQQGQQPIDERLVSATSTPRATGSVWLSRSYRWLKANVLMQFSPAAISRLRQFLRSSGQRRQRSPANWRSAGFDNLPGGGDGCIFPTPLPLAKTHRATGAASSVERLLALINNTHYRYDEEDLKSGTGHQGLRRNFLTQYGIDFILRRNDESVTTRAWWKEAGHLSGCTQKLSMTAITMGNGESRG